MTRYFSAFIFGALLLIAGQPDRAQGSCVPGACVEGVIAGGGSGEGLAVKLKLSEIYRGTNGAMFRAAPAECSFEGEIELRGAGGSTYVASVPVALLSGESEIATISFAPFIEMGRVTGFGTFQVRGRLMGPCQLAADATIVDETTGATKALVRHNAAAYLNVHTESGF